MPALHGPDLREELHRGRAFDTGGRGPHRPRQVRRLAHLRAGLSLRGDHARRRGRHAEVRALHRKRGRKAGLRAGLPEQGDHL